MNQRKKGQGLNQVTPSNAPAVQRPVAPPVYRPQPLPKVLQAKPAVGGCQLPNKHGGPGTQTKNHNLPQSMSRRQTSGPVTPVVQNQRQAAKPGVVNNRQNIQQRSLPSNQPRPHVAKPVVQRMEVESAIGYVPDDIILLILDVTARQAYRDVISFSLTSKRMFHLVSNDLRSINGILRTYGNSLEPLLHGAHLDIERLGLPGSGTILGLAVNGRLIPWGEVPKKYTSEKSGVNVDAWEGKVARKVSNYSEYSIKARPDREEIAKQEIPPKAKKALQKQSATIMEARKHSPAKTFKVFLLLNKGATSKEAQFTGQVVTWLTERSEMKRLLFKEPTVKEYIDLSSTQKEPSSCAHSEQLMLRTKQWEDIRIRFFEYAIAVFNNPPQDWVPAQVVTLLLNRSPCSSCGRFLVAELEAFWTALAKALGQPKEICQTQLKTRIVFRLAYTVEYGKLGIPSDQYPNLIILTALQKAGWLLDRLPSLAPQDRRPDACMNGATITVQPPQKFDLGTVQFIENKDDPDWTEESESKKRKRQSRGRGRGGRGRGRGRGEDPPSKRGRKDKG
jgi:hypothetical protein